MAKVPRPKRGEVWQVWFDPSVGAESRKRALAVVIDLDGTGRLPLRIVVPIRDWQPAFEKVQVSDRGRKRLEIDSATSRSQNRLRSSRN
jgi:mRNA-degrading endonuclease toxin of MazEF toxin-antitoxin module